MKNNLRKFAVLTSAVMLVFTGVSCSGKDSSSGTDASAVTVTQTMYKEERTSLPEDFSGLDNLQYVPDTGKCCLVYSPGADNIKAVVLDGDAQTEKSITLIEGESPYMFRSYIRNDGRITLLLMFVDYDKPEITDYEDFYENAAISFEIREYDSSGELTETVPVEGMDRYYSLETSHIEQFIPYGDNYLVNFCDGWALVDENGNVSDVQSFDENYYIGYDNDGNCIAVSMKNYGYMDTSQLKAPVEKIEFDKYLYGNGAPMPGLGGFTAYFRMNEGIFGLTESGELIQVLDYVDSQISSSEIYDLAPAGDGKFLTICNNGMKWYMSILTVRPDDYVENKQTVIVGVDGGGGDDVRSLATEFSKYSDNYTVEIKEYTFGDTDALKSDILSGNAPDVYMYKSSEIMHNFANMGAFLNMYDLMEQYGGFSEDDILDNIIEGLEYKDGLYAIGNEFILNLYLANSEVVGKEYSDWTFDEFFDIAENMPEDMYFSNQYGFDTPMDVFNYLCIYNPDAWIDYENASCNFDSPEFVRTLEFCRDVNILPERDWQEFNANTSQEEQTIDKEEQSAMLKNKTALISGSLFFSSADELHDSLLRYGMTNDEATFVSYPSDDGKSSFGIMNYMYSVVSNGGCTEGGWAFVNYIMSYDYQTQSSFKSFVTRKDAFEHNLLWNQEKSRLSAAGEADENGTYYFFAGEITDDDLDVIRDYTARCTHLSSPENDVQSVLTEEFSAFINGERSAEDCAKMIQNRVSIYLSENA